MKIQQIKKDIVEAMNSNKPKTSAYDTEATVVRVEGETAWVHIPGGVDETPVAMTINAREGDTVRVRVGGGTAWIIGNDTAPPTDDKTAVIAVKEAEAASRAVIKLDENLTQEEIFNRLTNNGAVQGLMLDPNTGDIYINATYIQSGVFRVLDEDGNTIFLADKDGHVFKWDMEHSALSENGRLILKEPLYEDTEEVNAGLVVVEGEEYDPDDPYAEHNAVYRASGAEIFSGTSKSAFTSANAFIHKLNLDGEVARTVFNIEDTTIGIHSGESGAVFNDRTLEEWITSVVAYQFKTYTKTYSIDAGEAKELAFTVQTPTDFTAVAARKVLSGSGSVAVRSFDVSTGKFYLRNMGDTALSNLTATFEIMYLATALYGTSGGGGGGSGTLNYNELYNKPQIDEDTLQGNRDLYLTNSDIEDLLTNADASD